MLHGKTYAQAHTKPCCIFVLPECPWQGHKQANTYLAHPWQGIALPAPMDYKYLTNY